MLDALTVPAQFRLVLGTPALARHARWAVHARPAPSGTELSTGVTPNVRPNVDDSWRSAPSAALGCVVPKRLARRSVTRSLVRRLARPIAADTQGRVELPMWWVLRLAAPIAPSEFRSATSDRLRQQLRREIEECFHLAASAWQRRQRGGVASRPATRSEVSS